MVWDFCPHLHTWLNAESKWLLLNFWSLPPSLPQTQYLLRNNFQSWQVGGLLQTMKVKRRTHRTDRSMSQDTVEAAAAAAKAAAAAVAEQAARLKASLDKPPPLDSASRSSGQNSSIPQVVVRAPTDSAAAVSTRMTSPINAEAGQAVGSVPVRQEHNNVNNSDGAGFGDVDDNSSATAGTNDGAGLSEAVMALRREGEYDAPDRGDDGEGLEREEVVEMGPGGVVITRDWASMTVVALKEELRARGLKVSGKKAALVDRLVEAGR